MSKFNTRREFLRAAAVAGVGTTLAGSSTIGNSKARAAEPVQRTGAAKFKFSLAAYSYRDLLTGQSPALTLSDFILDCAKMGLEGTELTSYYFPPEPTNEYLRQLKHECFRLGLDVSGTAVGNDFCHPQGEARDKELAAMKTWIDRAEILGAPVIRVFSGGPKEGQSVEDARRLAVSALEESCEYAGQHGVFLALENHGGLTTTADGVLSLVHAVKSPWFGVNLDSGNFHSSDIYGELAKIAPYALNVQIKVSVQPEGGQRQPSDFKRLASILTESGYRGYIVLEFEEPEEPRSACPRYMEKLREAFSAG